MISAELEDLHRWFAGKLATPRRIMPLVLVVLSSTLGIAATFAIGYFLGRRVAEEPRIWSTGPTVEHIRSLNQLVSTKVTISDVLTGEGEGVRGVWLIKGDALLGIDLTNPSVQMGDQGKRIAVIYLDQPSVIIARVDHERSMTWDVQRTTWIPWKGDEDRLRDKAMYNAQRLVEYAASRPEILEEAKRNAARALADVYRAVDWHVEIRWK